MVLTNENLDTPGSPRYLVDRMGPFTPEQDSRIYVAMMETEPAPDERFPDHNVPVRAPPRGVLYRRRRTEPRKKRR